VFWTYGFPLIMALALGYSFQPKPPEPVPVGVLAAADAERVVAALAGEPRLRVEVLDEAAAERALVRGRLAALLVPTFGLHAQRPTTAVAASDSTACSGLLAPVSGTMAWWWKRRPSMEGWLGIGKAKLACWFWPNTGATASKAMWAAHPGMPRLARLMGVLSRCQPKAR
jgi:hypothetical protein